VVHAIWSDQDRLHLWAEDGSITPPEPIRRRGRPPARPSPVDHPYAASNERLTEALISIGVPAPTVVAETDVAGQTATVWLPVAEGLPQSSPLLVRNTQSESHMGRADRLGLFSVPVLEFTPGPALEVVSGLGARALGEGDQFPLSIDNEIRVDDATALWAATAGLALEIVAGGRFLPSLRLAPDGTGVAKWDRLTYDHDSHRLALLAGALPSAGRAESEESTGEEPRLVVSRALDAMIDALCRESFTAAQMVPLRRRAALSSAPAIESWLAALGDADPVVEAPAGELAKLERQLAEWAEPVTRMAGVWRLCFRLVEPVPDDDESDSHPEGVVTAGTINGVGSVVSEPKWHLELLLQARDDPSLIVRGEEVWQAGATLQHAARTIDAPQEVLLAELGRAQRFHPDLAEVLRDRTPTGMSLDTAGAYRFLRESAPGLELAGFGVLLPAWWHRPAASLGLRLHTTPRASSGTASSGLLGVNGILDYDWEAALGDAPIEESELRALARLKAPLVKVRGQWVEFHPGEVDRLLDFLQREGRRTSRAMTVGQALQFASGVANQGLDIPVLGVKAEGWLASLFDGDVEAVLEEVGTPAGFDGELRPYQQRGLGWLQMLGRLGLGGCLADDMGLGKTATLLALELTDRLDSDGHRIDQKVAPTLVVCPTSVVGNWQREAQRFAPDLRVEIHHGVRRTKGDAFVDQVGGADLVITSYALTARDRTSMARVPWGRVVLDEAQNVKNPGAQQTKAVRSLAAAQKVALTGTPVENHLGELWSIMELVNPGLLGSASSFRERFALPIERYRDEEAAERLRLVTRPFVLRRLKTDRTVITDLPEKFEMKVLCNLTREQATLYQAVVDDMLEKIDVLEGIERKGLVLSAMLRLKQVCNHPAHYLGDGSVLANRSGKLERTVAILEEVLEGGERALIFTQFAEMGRLLRQHLAARLGCQVSFLHGGVPRRQRDEMVEDFQTGGLSPLMVLSLKAGGTGLNLTSANHVIHFDRWWNPAVENQATDRAFRIGQNKNVQVRKLVCDGTLEDRIDQMISQKQELADRIVGADEGWLTELSTDELADMFRLSSDAVSAG
jgi:superfamily II DNA or RNA helicase